LTNPGAGLAAEPQPFPGASPVTLARAALALHRKFQHEPWFHAVGVDKDADGAPYLILYARDTGKAAVGLGHGEHEGFPVLVRPAFGPKGG
jgi:hypothetical protein